VNRHLRLARVGVAGAAFLAAVLWGFRLGASQSGGFGPPPRPLVELAFLAIYESPALLGGVGLAVRSAAPLAAGGALAVILAFTSFGLVTVPLLLPAALMIGAVPDLPRRSWTRLTTVCLVALGLAAFAALFGPRESLAYMFPGGSGVSEVPTLPGAAASLLLVAAAVVTASAPAFPHRERRLAP
jgi:hypothetical protein